MTPAIRDGSSVVHVGDTRPGVITFDVLRYLGLDPQDISARALVLIASRYGLDPLLGQVAVIRTGNGQRVYVTRDGLLAVAHRTGKLDGIVVDEERRNSTDDGWTARVSVYVKGCAHPFTYGAQCKDSEAQAKAGNGPEMALARAERRALRRAFSVPTGNARPGATDGEDLDVIADDVVDIDGAPPDAPPPPRVKQQLSDQSAAHSAVAAMTDEDRSMFLARHDITDYGTVWPDTAVLDAIGKTQQ